MKIFSWLISGVLAVIVAGFLFLFFSPDYNMRLVRSESMKPAINMGDMVITGPLGGPLNGEVKTGSIVTYQYGEELITHRVLSVDGETLVTKGDAVEDPDPWPVTLSDVHGVYLFKIPYIGYIANFVGTRFGWFIVIILPATALVALLVRDIFKEKGRDSEKVSYKKKEVMPRDSWD
jgi:signal peptidase